MDNQTKNMEDVLKLLDRVNETFTYGIWIPSLNKEVLFREINTSQQKRLIKSIIDSPVYNTEFICTLRQVLIENCVDKDVKIDDLTILDKLFIAIKMRSVSISDTFEMEIPIDEKKNKSIKRGFSLEKIIAESRKELASFPSQIIQDERNVYTLECSIPTIGTEYALERDLRENIEAEEINTNEKLRETLGTAFIGEVTKYINTISINDGKEISKIDLANLSFKNRITLIEKLPEKVTLKVIDYINEVKKILDKVVLVKTTYDEKGKIKEIEQRLNIDGNFFITT